MKRVHVIFLGVVYAYAQTWNAMNKLPDGRAQSLAIGYKPITGEQFIYAADDMSWPYRSINEGEWDSLIGSVPHQPQCPRVIITNPQDARHVYIARGDGVYYSGDFGGTWEHRWDPSLNPLIWTLAMVPGNSGYVYAGCKKAEGYHNTLYYTQDFGRTWYPVEEFPNEWVYDISIYNENWIFVTTHENFVIDSIMITIVNVYRYDGLTWERIYSYIGDIFIKIKVDPNNRQRVFMAEIFWTQEYIILKRSLDGGNNWETIFTLSGYDADIEIGPTGWVYVSGIGEGIYRSQTGNPNSFVNITNNMYDKYILDIKVDPRDQNKVYVGTNFNIYKTHNGVSPNVVWEEFNEGMRKVHPSNFSLCLPSIIYASAKGCIYSTTNMGENWVVKGGSTRDPGENLITEIAVNPFNENKVIAGVDFNIREGAKIMKTEDGGNLWETTWQTFTWYHRISNCIFNFNNPSIIFFTRQSQPYLLKSIDGGNHWQENIHLVMHTFIYFNSSLRLPNFIYWMRKFWCNKINRWWI